MNSPSRLLTVEILVIGLVVSCWPAMAVAQVPAEGRKLTVSSTATVHADPDTAVITFAVTAKGGTGKEAREDLDKRAKVIKDAITSLKLTGVTIDVVPAPLQPLV